MRFVESDDPGTRGKLTDDDAVLDQQLRVSEAEERRILASPSMRLLDVPPVRMFTNGCGYASLEMLLSFHGFSVDRFKLFKEFNRREYNRSQNPKGQPKAPTYSSLSELAKGVAGDQFDYKLIDEEAWRKVLERPDHKATPMGVLYGYITRYQVPVMLRIPGHTIVARGYDPTPPIGDHRPIYVVNDPVRAPQLRFMPEDELNARWGNRTGDTDSGYFTNGAGHFETHFKRGGPITSTSYLMFAMRKRESSSQ